MRKENKRSCHDEVDSNRRPPPPVLPSAKVGLDVLPNEEVIRDGQPKEGLELGLVRHELRRGARAALGRVKQELEVVKHTRAIMACLDRSDAAYLIAQTMLCVLAGPKASVHQRNQALNTLRSAAFASSSIRVKKARPMCKKPSHESSLARGTITVSF